MELETRFTHGLDKMNGTKMFRCSRLRPPQSTAFKIPILQQRCYRLRLNTALIRV